MVTFPVTGSRKKSCLIFIMITLCTAVVANNAMANQVVSLTLVDSVTDQDIMPLANADTINLSVTGMNLNIRADVGGSVGSVRFALDANSNFRLENGAPYALAGDTRGDYLAWTPSLGSHVLTATPYSKSNATGTKGIPLSINFTVVDKVLANLAPVITDGPHAIPNPITLPERCTVSVVASNPDADTLTYTWSKAAGPGAVSFSDPNAAATELSFTAAGSYTLDVAVSDGQATISASLEITVNSGPPDEPYPWPTDGWDTATPAEMKMDAAKLEQARNYALTGGGSGFITRGGMLVMEWGNPQGIYEIKSATKSIGVTALGLAIKDGLVELNDMAQIHFSDVGVPPDSNLNSGWLDHLSLHHLAAHTGGFGRTGGYTEFLFEPGTAWAYSDSGANWLADILTVTYAEDLYSLLNRRVFSVLGIDPSIITWRSNANRSDLLFGIKRRELASGIYTTVDAMARFGYLYLRNGQWEGEQIVPQSFVDLARTSSPEVTNIAVVNDTDSKFAKANRHYGLLWWNNADGAMANVPKDAYWAFGLGDNIILVIPSLDIVASRAGSAWPGNRSPSFYSVIEPFIESIALSAMAAKPSVHPAGGWFDQAVPVSLDASAPGDVIRYTIDGNDPTPDSPVYSGPFVMDHHATLKTRAYREDYIPSLVTSATFVIGGSPAPEVFSDDFSTDSRSQYLTSNTWTQGGVGKLAYNGADQRLGVITGDNIGLQIGRTLQAATGTGVLTLDFLPWKKYPTGGIFKLRLLEKPDSYYEVENTDGYGPGSIRKVVNGKVVSSAVFLLGYQQNSNYTVRVTFSPNFLRVEGFGSEVVLNLPDGGLGVESLEVELRQQDAYIDNIHFQNFS